MSREVRSRILRWCVVPAMLMWHGLPFISGAAANAAEPRRPNIIVIMADDLGYADVGVQGCRDVATPHLDALANAGVRCTDGYVCCPVCCPSRAGLLTGRYPQRTGFEFNTAGPNTGLDLNEKTMADLLLAQGYATGLVGKWHLGNAPQFHPLQRGFSEFFGMVEGAHHYLPSAQIPEPKTPGDAFIYKLTPRGKIVRNRTPIEQEPEYLTEEFAKQASLFIERHRERPFFLFVSFNAVHVPLQATPKYLDRVADIADPQRRTYAAMLSALDDGVGVIQRTLTERQLDRQTLVFFLSDNGGQMGAGGAKNGPLRGQKSTAFEGGIRVPFFVKWTDHLPAGRTYLEPVISLDILPTALAAAGAAVPAEPPLDGVNLLPCLRGDNRAPPHDSLYWRYGNERAIRRGRWKLTMPAEGRPGLYDLLADVSESKDESAAQPEIVDDLSRRFNDWSSKLPPPKWRSLFGKDSKARRP